MLPGPIFFRKCPSCKGLIAQGTLRSGNTIGATFWTDGKMDAPMLPDSPSLVACPHCKAPLWINELEKIGEDMFIDPGGAFKDARGYSMLEFAGYLDFLGRETLTPEKERNVRIRAWWAGNDWRRKGDEQALSDDEASNLLRLAESLDDSDEDRVMKAEIFRELGRFDEAAAILAGTFDDDCAQAAAFIRGLVAKRDARVQEMVVG